MSARKGSEDDGLTAAERLRQREQEYLEQMQRQEEVRQAAERAQARVELRRMRAQEMLQCSFSDRFWGLDFRAYEMEREEWERQCMWMEDELIESIRRAEKRRNDEEAAAYQRWQAEQHARELEREHRETVAMATEEGLQTAIDRFWGVQTFEKHRRAKAEQRLKQEEERRIAEQAEKLRQLQAEWTKQGQEIERRKRLEEARNHELVRQQYMSMFFSATSSADIIQFHWPSFTDAEDILTELREKQAAAVAQQSSVFAMPSTLPSPGGGVEAGESIMSFASVSSASRKRRGFDMGVVYAPERVQSPVHVLHRLNPVRTVGKRHMNVAADASHFSMVPDLRPGGAPGVPPVDYKPSTKPPKQMIKDVKRKAAATRVARRGSTSTGTLQWPVPSKEARNASYLTVRGWVCAAAQVLRHLDKPDKLRKNLKKYQRTYCALWKTSALYFFDNAKDSRAFFNSVGEPNNTCSGYIDLESVVAVRERKPQSSTEHSDGATNHDGGDAGASEAGGGDVADGGDASAGSQPGSDSGTQQDGSGDVADGDGGIGAHESNGDAEPPQKKRAQPLPLRVLELVGIGQTWYVIPDPAEAEEAAIAAWEEKTAELEEVEGSIDALEAEAVAKERESAAAARKGPREGNYRLKVKAQGARARADTAVTKAEALHDAVDAAAAKADNARDAHFELWRNTIAQGVEARNHEVALLTHDDELRRPCDEVDASRMQGSTLDLVRAVSLSKLGPWAMPVDHMGTIEVLVNQYKTRNAGPGVGSPAQGSPTQAADGAAATAKAGLQRGRINVLKEEFGFIRPEDMSGDRDIYFRVSDIVGSARAGDEVTYDTVRDERGSTDKDLRAVNICRMDIEPYASYDDLDTMPWQDTNAAHLWCTESLARPPSEPGSARGAPGTPAPGTPQSHAKAARSDATGAGRGKRKGRKGRSRARRPRTGGLDISPVNTNRKRAGRRPKSTLPAALATRGGGDGSAAGGARPTTPGGSVMPLPKLAQQPREGAAGGDGALPAWRAGTTGRPPRRRKPKASHGPSGELAPILRRGQMLA